MLNAGTVKSMEIRAGTAAGAAGGGGTTAGRRRLTRTGARGKRLPHGLGGGEDGCTAVHRTLAGGVAGTGRGGGTNASRTGSIQ